MDLKCLDCGSDRQYNETCDTYFCESCDKWLEETCGDEECEYCVFRPPKPSYFKSFQELGKESLDRKL